MSLSCPYPRSLPVLRLLLVIAASSGCGGTGAGGAGGTAGAGNESPESAGVRVEGEGMSGSGTDAAPVREGENAARVPRLPARGSAWVILEGDTVVAEVARTHEERSTGLMNRSSVPDGTGMLFVFDDAAVRSFWMRDTYVPLDIAFIDPDLRIVDVQRMEPEVTDPYDSAAPAMFALEVPGGWFAEHGWGVGDVVEIAFGG